MTDVSNSSLWKTVLIDWINKTEWLNGYYEDIVHTDIQQFFTKLSKIFGPMNSDSVCDFIKDNYHGFLCSFYNGGADGDHRDQLAKEDYFYAYTLLLNFVCVKRRDKDMQRICNNMEKAQKTMIANVFRGLLRLDYYPPCGIQLVIEEAEAEAEKVKAKAVSMVSTPRTKALNEFFAQNRKLKAQLETQQFKDAHRESHLEQQLKILERKYQQSETRIKLLQLNLEAADNKTPQKVEIKNDREVSRLKIALERKSSECLTLDADKQALEGQLMVLEARNSELSKNIQALTLQNVALDHHFKDAQDELKRTNETNGQLSSDNKELQHVIEELRSQLMNQTAPESSFDGTYNVSIAMPENMADVLGQDHQPTEQEVLDQTRAVITEFQAIRGEYFELLSLSNQDESGTVVDISLSEIPQEIRKVTAAFRMKIEEMVDAKEMVKAALYRAKSESKKLETENLILEKRLNGLNEENAKWDAEIRQMQKAMKKQIHGRDQDVAIFTAKLKEARKMIAVVMADKAADNGKNEEEKAQLKHQIQKLKQRLALVENIPIGNALSSSNMPVKSSPKARNSGHFTGGYAEFPHRYPFESITNDELERRNSACPPHLRSAYAAQYCDYRLKRDSTFKVDPDSSGSGGGSSERDY